MADRKTSPLGDMRERGVACQRCRRETWNIVPICDQCMDRDTRAPQGNAKPKEKK